MGKKNTKGLYLCQFDQGTLKIGMGANAQARLTAHKGAGAVFGIFVTRSDIIECDNPRVAEKILIDWCIENSSVCNGREWFKGVDYAECLATAKAIASTMIGPHQTHTTRMSIVDRIFGMEQKPLSKEAAFYREVRDMMLTNSVDTSVINAFDFLHSESESVRKRVLEGGAEPGWFETLNSFDPWEIELWFDNGNPTNELLSAAAAAITSMGEPA